MDPNEALRIIRAYTVQEPADPIHALEELRDACRALDEWITSGGFLPADWQASR